MRNLSETFTIKMYKQQSMYITNIQRTNKKSKIITVNYIYKNVMTIK